MFSNFSTEARSKFKQRGPKVRKSFSDMSAMSVNKDSNDKPNYDIKESSETFTSQSKKD